MRLKKDLSAQMNRAGLYPTVLDIQNMLINLQKQIDALYELADLGYEDGNGGLTHADCENIEKLLAARKEVVEDE